MIAPHRGFTIVAALFWVMVAFSSAAQPTLPDLTGEDEDGLALLSWTCQYDGVKSISVLRSSDSNFNYSTIGYVKNLYKGVQAFVDGHPEPGKNFYKLFIVFNSGLTWRSNHHGVYIDPESLDNKRIIPSNEALQKLIVNENSGEKPAKAEPNKNKKTTASAPAEKEKYTEVLKKGMEEINDTSIKRPKFKFVAEEEPDLDNVANSVQEEHKRKLAINYSDDTGEINPDDYIEDNKPETKKKISITFDEEEDVSSFIETLPKSTDRKITISYNEDSNDLNTDAYIDETQKPDKNTSLTKMQTQQPKKISVTFKNEAAAQAYMVNLPKTSHSKITVSYSTDSVVTPPVKTARVAVAAAVVPSAETPPPAPKPKIRIKFNDDVNANASSDVKSKYVSVDQVSGHVKVNMPDDIAMHSYSLKFFDKDNHAVIEVPKVNTQVFILDKHNFQKKGQYKFTIRKDVTEFESGYITIF